MKVHVRDRFFCDLCGAEMERLSNYKKDFIMAKDFVGWGPDSQDTIVFRDLCDDCKKKIARCMKNLRDSKGKSDTEPLDIQEQKIAFGEKVRTAMLEAVDAFVKELSRDHGTIATGDGYAAYFPMVFGMALEVIKKLVKRIESISPRDVANEEVPENILNSLDGDDYDNYDDRELYDVDDDEDDDSEDEE